MGWSYPRIAARVGLPTTTVAGLMQRRRMTKKLRPLAAESLRYYYVDRRLSMVKVAQSLGVPKSNVEYWMNKHGIMRRPLLKYPRYPFGGDMKEKAYLFGLRLGDLYVIRDGYGILVNTTTTHPAMLNLFRAAFEGYGHVASIPSYNRRTSEYQWSTRVILHPSFSFLLRKTKRVPKWIARDKLLFLHFLAGFVDAEGSIWATFRDGEHRRKVAESCLSISNTNVQLLRHIASLAKEYSPRLWLSKRAGSATSRKGAIRKKDVWEVTVSRRASLSALLRVLPLRHSEKIERSALVVELAAGCEWERGRKRFEALRVRTRNEVRQLARLGNVLLKGRAHYLATQTI